MRRQALEFLLQREKDATRAAVAPKPKRDIPPTLGLGLIIPSGYCLTLSAASFATGIYLLHDIRDPVQPTLGIPLMIHGGLTLLAGALTLHFGLAKRSAARAAATH